MLKCCSMCLIKKIKIDFWKNKVQPDGLDNLCKQCRKDSINKYRKKISSSRPIKSEPTIEEIAIKLEKNKQRKKFNQIKLNYGLTQSDYEQLEKSQNYCCKICNQLTKLCVDHCHLTGKVRGLLCTNCNRGIGYLKESIYNLENAIQYIKLNKVE